MTELLFDGVELFICRNNYIHSINAKCLSNNIPNLVPDMASGQVGGSEPRPGPSSAPTSVPLDSGVPITGGM